MKSLIILAGAIAITLLTGSRIMPIIKVGNPHPPSNCNNTMDPTTQSTYIHVDIPAVDGLMCAITAFFTEARVNSEAISPRLWDVIASPLLDYFVAAFVAMSIEDSRFGPKFIPLLSWGVLHTILRWNRLAAFRRIPRLPCSLVGSMGPSVNSSPPLAKTQDPNSPLHSDVPPKFAATAFVSVAFLIFSLFISHGPLALMKPMVFVFQWFPTFAPILLFWPFTMVFEKKGDAEGDAMKASNESSVIAINVYHFFAGILTVRHFLLVISFLPYFIPTVTEDGKAMFTLLGDFLVKPFDTAPQTLWTTVFLAIDNVSLGATVLLWVVAVKGKSVLSILGALIYVVVAVPLVGVGATVLMAAVEREREVMALRAKLGMTAVDGGKKKKRA